MSSFDEYVEGFFVGIMQVAAVQGVVRSQNLEHPAFSGRIPL
jgi:hypothetical protein